MPEVNHHHAIFTGAAHRLRETADTLEQLALQHHHLQPIHRILLRASVGRMLEASRHVQVETQRATGADAGIRRPRLQIPALAAAGLVLITLGLAYLLLIPLILRATISWLTAHQGMSAVAAEMMYAAGGFAAVLFLVRSAFLAASDRGPAAKIYHALAMPKLARKSGDSPQTAP